MMPMPYFIFIPVGEIHSTWKQFVVVGTLTFAVVALIVTAVILFIDRPWQR